MFKINSIFCKAVVVVPRFHLSDDGLGVAIWPQYARLTVVVEHSLYVRRAESQHLVEERADGDVPADVEPAGQVVQCHRADPGEEDAFKVPFEFLEDVTVEPLGMGDGVIDCFSLLVEHHVREVVVLVDDEIERYAEYLRLAGQQVQLVRSVLRGIELSLEPFRVSTRSRTPRRAVS